MSFATRLLVAVSLIVWSCHHLPGGRAEPPARPFEGGSGRGSDLACDIHLRKYRTFMLQSLLTFGDVCDSRATPLNNFQPSGEHIEMWSFFKVLLDQFNDPEFNRLLRDSVSEHCRMRGRAGDLQLDEKRNAVVLGKKQRFHSWGGKRAAATPSGPSSQLDSADYGGEEYSGGGGGAGVNKRLFFL